MHWIYVYYAIDYWKWTTSIIITILAIGDQVAKHIHE